MDSIGKEIGVKAGDMSPWYKVDRNTLKRLGANGMLRWVYSSSIYSMLKKVYPEHKWVPWMFRKIPSNVIGDVEVLKECLEYIESAKEVLSFTSSFLSFTLISSFPDYATRRLV